MKSPVLFIFVKINIQHARFFRKGFLRKPAGISQRNAAGVVPRDNFMKSIEFYAEDRLQ
ncbi:hypothetical protein HMPREF3293_01473 [Christensenella minuta]|uniref:Uncharacterized protein n=1 Tax=Christensenella minuta TaxID=626937 RepID=A0A136Q506_9FIRM|nr:hypothetical protein HMPREF3293_01473 [Christensenella minuta]